MTVSSLSSPRMSSIFVVAHIDDVQTAIIGVSKVGCNQQLFLHLLLLLLLRKLLGLHGLHILYSVGASRMLLPGGRSMRLNHVEIISSLAVYFYPCVH